MQYQIYVKPGAKQEKIVENDGPDGKLYTIFTHARAHDGEANAAVVKILAKHLGVPKGQIVIKNGQKSRHKTVEVL